VSITEHDHVDIDPFTVYLNTRAPLIIIRKMRSTWNAKQCYNRYTEDIFRTIVLFVNFIHNINERLEKGHHEMKIKMINIFVIVRKQPDGSGH